jgi:large subunit ribosomal protein L23
MILKKPIVTEKVSAQNEKGVYGFVVDNKANKVEIKKAVEKMYGVTVEAVRTMRYAGKKKTRQTMSKVVTGRTPSFKKAFVKLKEGDIIDFYSGI